MMREEFYLEAIERSKVWFITGAPGNRREIAKAALIEGNQVVASGRKSEPVTGALF